MLFDDVTTRTGHDLLTASVTRAIGPFTGQSMPTALDISSKLSDISAAPVKFGGLSDVYQAIWNGPQGRAMVAIKVARLRAEDSSRLLKRHWREIKLWYELDHPNVLPLLGVCHGHWELPAMVSPWCVNGDLRTYLRSRSGDTNIAERKLELLEQVLRGLSYLHLCDPPIVHGDIKCANVLISEDGKARLCDFGFAKMLAGRSASSSASHLGGTIRWMAPELLLGKHPRHTTRSDMWAFGCLCLEVETGSHPYWHKANEHAVIVALARGELPKRPSRMLDWLWQLATTCLVIEPRGRARASRVLLWLTKLAVSYTILADVILTTTISSIRHVAEIILESIMPRTHSPCPDLITYSWFMNRRCWEELRDSDEVSYPLTTFLHACMHVASKDTDLILSTGAAIVQVVRELSTLGHPVQVHQPRNPVAPLAELLRKSDDWAASRLELLFNASSQDVRCAASPVTSLVWASFEQGIVWVHRSGALYTYHPASGETKMVREAMLPHDLPFTIICPNGKSITRVDSRHESVEVIDIMASTVRLKSSAPPSGFLATALASSRDGTCVAVVSHADPTFTEFWRRNVAERVRLNVVASPESISVSPDGRYIATGEPGVRQEPGRLRIWSTLDGGCLASIVLSHENGKVTKTAFSPDGRCVLSGSSTGMLALYHDWTIRSFRSTPTRLWKTAAHTAPVTAVAYAPDGQRVASSSLDRRVSVWAATTGERIFELYCAGAPVRAMGFSPDSLELAFGSDEGIITAWRPTTPMRSKHGRERRVRMRPRAATEDPDTIVEADSPNADTISVCTDEGDSRAWSSHLLSNGGGSRSYAE